MKNSQSISNLNNNTSYNFSGFNYPPDPHDFEEDELEFDDTDEGIVNDQLNNFSQKKMISAMTNSTAIEHGISNFTQ